MGTLATAPQAIAATQPTANSPSALTSTSTASSTSAPDRLADPGKALPGGWQQSSDEAVTVVGDGTGLHVLAASESSGYAWKSVATLGDPSVQTDMWIGQACVTSSGVSAVVVYAPEQVTNMAGAQGELGRAAVVNLRTGAVKDLGGGFSVAYFNPGCGTGNTAVLTEGGWAADSGSTSLVTTLAVVDTAAGKVSSTVRVPSQVSSAVPYQGQIAAVGEKGLEEINGAGVARRLAATPGVAYQLTPDASGGLGYQTVVNQQVGLWRLAAGKAKKVASVAKGAAQLRQIGGQVWLVGPDASKVSGLPAQWRAVDAPVTAQPSSTGTLVVSAAGSVTPAGGKGADPDAPAPASISAQLLAGSHQSASFVVPTTNAPPVAPASGKGAASSSGGVHPMAAPGASSTPVSADRTCAIALDDPTVQAYQPTFAQVEWAADQAVQGSLTNTRPTGLYGSSLTSYTPQAMFPLPSIDGGSTLPAQVLLGVLTQESNLQQASTHVIQGQTSNPLSSYNWYGNWTNDDTYDTGELSWTDSDCGYGIGQITSGMCLSQYANGDQQCQQTPLPGEEQLAVAVDYQANIAAAAQYLVKDWNQLWNDGIQPNNLAANSTDPISYSPSDNPAYIENWYMTLWAYNSGLEPGTPALGNDTGCTPGPSCTDGNGDWGLGYADNPVNLDYPPDRPTFATASSSLDPDGSAYTVSWDLSHPQYWPYEDKVLAFAFDSATLYDYSQGKNVQVFAFAHGNYTSPPADLFCSMADNCDDSLIDDGIDPCQLTAMDYDDHCWWHVDPPDSWQILDPSVCPDCGVQVLTYPADAADPGAEPIAAGFAQTCTESPLPSNAVIVGDGGQAALGCPGRNWTAAGSMTWNFAPDSDGNYSSKIGFDQIGAGFGGHFWFGYTQPNDSASASSITPESGYASKVITGTWTPPGSVTGWTDVKVAIPSYGANAVDANYQVAPGGGQPTRNVQVNQEVLSGANTWVDLGDFYLGSGAHVSLSNVVSAGAGGIPGIGVGVDIAWDSAAFIPVQAPAMSYVAMGDSFASGEGLSPYLTGTDTSTDTCHRSQSQAYPELVTLPGQSAPISVQSPSNFTFIACSGAETIGVSAAAINPVNTPKAVYATNANEPTYNLAGNTDWGYEQYSNDAPWASSKTLVEGLQEQNPNLNPSTQLITLSIGGNDARFADIMQGCLTAVLNVVTGGIQDCSNGQYVLTRSSTGAQDQAPLYQFEPVVEQYLQAHLLQTYLAVNSLAPNADIIVTGYPQIFPASPTAPCDSGTSVLGASINLSVNAQVMLNQFSTNLNHYIDQAVGQAQAAGVDIQFVDPTAAFAGHALCSGSPWFQPLGLPVAASYHPTAAGQQAYATLVNQCLAGEDGC
jgi:hypothetical protein